MPRSSARGFHRFARPLTAALQAVVLLFSCLTMLMYVSLVPGYINKLTTSCLPYGCDGNGPTPPIPETVLRESGWTFDTYALAFAAIDTTLTLGFAIVAFIILRMSRREPMALLCVLMLISLGATFPSLLYVMTADHPGLRTTVSIVDAVGWVALFTFFLLFPRGRLTAPWTAIPLLLFAAAKLARTVAPDTALDHSLWPIPLQIALFAAPIAAVVYVQAVRYRNPKDSAERQQSKWMLYGVTVGFTVFLVISCLFGFLPLRSPDAFVYLNAFLHLFLLVIPVTLAFAVLRLRLWDIDPVVFRTIVYVLLSTCILLLYSASIFAFGQWFRSEDGFLPSLLSAVVVAVAFAPLREWLQRTVRRLLKGKHDDPYGALSELRHGLSRPAPPEAMLDPIVRTVRSALRIPYAAIAIEVNGQERVVASDGAPHERVEAFPISHVGRKTGSLLASHRPEEPFTVEDRRLLDVLLGAAGPMADNFRMTQGMKLLAEDLQQSRERLVLAREEERRRLSRNLHDELAPRLAAIGLNATAAEMHAARNPEAAAALLGDLRATVRRTVEDIRSLVHDMRPAGLEEWGLIGAVRERMRELTSPIVAVEDGTHPAGLRMKLQAVEPLPALPAAVEVAAYWIATESIANVVRHANATSCVVRIALESGGRLVVEVTDDGVGIDDRRGATGGIGLGSIRERAAELGGHCAIERLPSGGTRVSAWLPAGIRTEDSE
ncbi:sensor histidine kinase [Paenibacillus sp.]|uniref:sensor histidine kinase n=1 Tax=Paenibacillus sp. TaxID=58172 RepID=UPI002D30233C|nr:histidine kinase [Paenibacillus sp.]HZG57204.1 histidine kinase [Paenibacillus sp.]